MATATLSVEQRLVIKLLRVYEPLDAKELAVKAKWSNKRAKHALASLAVVGLIERVVNKQYLLSVWGREAFNQL